LGCEHLLDSHSGENIAKALKNLLENWNLKLDPAHLLVADNAANMKKGVEGAKIYYQPSCIHTLYSS
jgi:5S rRNA maturation endonuclease (ribonuclease M5)